MGNAVACVSGMATYKARFAILWETGACFLAFFVCMGTARLHESSVGAGSDRVTDILAEKPPMKTNHWRSASPVTAAPSCAWSRSYLRSAVWGYDDDYSMSWSEEWSRSWRRRIFTSHSFAELWHTVGCESFGMDCF